MTEPLRRWLCDRAVDCVVSRRCCGQTLDAVVDIVPKFGSVASLLSK